MTPVLTLRPSVASCAPSLRSDADVPRGTRTHASVARWAPRFSLQHLQLPLAALRALPSALDTVGTARVARAPDRFAVPALVERRKALPALRSRALTLLVHGATSTPEHIREESQAQTLHSYRPEEHRSIASTSSALARACASSSPALTHTSISARPRPRDPARGDEECARPRVRGVESASTPSSVERPARATTSTTPLGSPPVGEPQRSRGGAPSIGRMVSAPTSGRLVAPVTASRSLDAPKVGDDVERLAAVSLAPRLHTLRLRASSRAVRGADEREAVGALTRARVRGRPALASGGYARPRSTCTPRLQNRPGRPHRRSFTARPAGPPDRQHAQKFPASRK